MTSSEASAVCMSPQYKGWCHTKKLTFSRNMLAQLNPKYECFNLFETPSTYAPLTVMLPGAPSDRVSEAQPNHTTAPRTPCLPLDTRSM